MRVAFQHNNGGLWVDNNYQTNIANLFAIGEVAGAHGVARPGGSALNSGQVGGARVAQFLSRQGVFSRNDYASLLAAAADSVVTESRRMLSVGGAAHRDIRTTVQQSMTSAAGFIRRPEQVRSAVSSSVALLERVKAQPPAADCIEDLSAAWETRGLCRASTAYLKSIDAYVSSGGGSRGSYMVVCDEYDQSAMRGEVTSLTGKLFDFRKERIEDRQTRVVIDGRDLSVASEEVRPIPTDESWFETAWAMWKSNQRA